MKNAKLYLSMLDNPFGKFVAEARIKKNLSQRELAQKIGKSATYINYVERGFNPASKSGKFQPSRESVEKLAKVLDLNLNEALRLAGFASEINIPDDIILESYDGFSQEDIDKIVSYIRFVREQKKQGL